MVLPHEHFDWRWLAAPTPPIISRLFIQAGRRDQLTRHSLRSEASCATQLNRLALKTSYTGCTRKPRQAHPRFVVQNFLVLFRVLEFYSSYARLRSRHVGYISCDPTSQKNGEFADDNTIKLNQHIKNVSGLHHPFGA